MAIRNLLRESILEAKKLKQASAESTKDRLLEKLTSDLKRKLRQQDQDEDILLDDEEMTEQEQILDDEEIFEQDQFDADQEIADDLDDQIQEAIDDLQSNEDQPVIEQQQQTDQEIQDIITELEAEQEQQPIMEEDDDVEEVEDDDDDDDQALIERIKSILEAEGQENEEWENVVTEEQNTQGTEVSPSQQIVPDVQVIESFRKKVKQLTSENRKYRNSLQKINQQLNETKCLQMKGNYAIKLFNKFNLNKNQKMAIIENFDRAKNEREIKLVYATLFQGLKDTNAKKPIIGKKPVVSSKIKSTKSKVRQSRDIIENDYQPISEIFRRKVGILN